MKKFFLMMLLTGACIAGFGQAFEKAISTAQSSYSAGKLDETHFALQQALVEVDLIIGKEVLKLLPPQMDTMPANAALDHVSSNQGFVGATIFRSYGKSARKADLSIISNSPLVATMNSLLNTPLMGAMMSDPNNKTVKVQGYKGRLSAMDIADNKKRYDLQIPLGSALISFTVADCTESEMLAMASTLPLQQIAKLIQ